eukprot:7442474-Lingulodinium_polyedra.AAC.1
MRQLILLCLHATLRRAPEGQIFSVRVGSVPAVCFGLVGGGAENHNGMLVRELLRTRLQVLNASRGLNSLSALPVWATVAFAGEL